MVQKKFTASQITAYVKKELAETCRKRDLDLQLEIVGRKQEDGWLHLFVRPTNPKFSAEDYVRALAEVEMQAEEEFKGLQLLLVPVSPEEPSRPAKRGGQRRRSAKTS